MVNVGKKTTTPLSAKEPNMRINIYLSTKTEDKLTEIRKKYHVSLSTIAQILTDYFRPNFKEYGNNFFTTYMDSDHRKKTTIKPNNLDESSEMMQLCKGELSACSHVYSNLLYLYANECWYDLFPNNNKSAKGIEKQIKQLNNEFIKKREIYWNYNNNLRQQIRIVRKNADYFKRILNA